MFKAHFLKDQRGSVVPIFGLVATLTFGFVGAAVDYSRANAAKATMQSALDATALMLARDSLKMSDEALTAKARPMFAAQLGTPDLTITEFTANRTTNEAGAKVTMNTKASLNTTIMRVMGQMKFDLASHSEIAWGNTKYEIALVIDNSSSMADSFGTKSKVDAAKDAAIALSDTIFDSAVMANQTKISVVPYTSAVNVGAEYKDSWWVDKDGAASTHWQNITKPTGATSRFTLFDWLGEQWNGCFETRTNALGFTDDPPTAGNASTLFVPMFAPDEPGTKATPTNSNGSANLYKNWGSNSYDAYNSYLDDDDQGGLSCGTMPTGNSSTDWTNIQKRGCKYKIAGAATKKNIFTNSWGIKIGPNFMCNAVKMLRLSTDRTAVSSKVAELKALGDTTMFEGVAWGWRTLSPEQPFRDGRAYPVTAADKQEFQKVSSCSPTATTTGLGSTIRTSRSTPDGLHTNDRLRPASRKSPWPTRRSIPRPAGLRECKGEGRADHVVGIMLPDKPLPAAWQDVLSNCASVVEGKQQLFISTNGDQLVATFKGIAQSILRIHVSH